jgi:S-adenosylmethionine:tRNA ribosyltransferase-isomerase
MRLDDLDYALPASLIAQHPPKQRDGARLLILDRSDGHFADALFSDLPNLLRGNELLVFNNARVLPARLFGRRQLASMAAGTQTPDDAGTQVEVFLSREIAPDTWEALVKPGKTLHMGTRILFGSSGQLQGNILSRGDFGLRTVAFSSRDAHTVAQHFDSLGHMPLPPYIDRADTLADRERYQTVFNKRPVAVAAPTAGLHFTPQTLEAIRARGIATCELTLNVGLGTFQPVRSETLESHVMHAEYYDIPPATAKQICEAHAAGRPILAVGTTVVRALEAAASRAAQSGSARLLEPGPGEATLFMIPGFSFRVVHALLTNFHLPRSTLLALVSAFAGHERVLNAYRHAVSSGYRFYSYGDCMLIC